MRLWEVLKIHDETGGKIRPKGQESFSLPTLIECCSPMYNHQERINQEWEVELIKVEVSREQLASAIDKHFYNNETNDRVLHSESFKRLCKELGL